MRLHHHPSFLAAAVGLSSMPPLPVPERFSGATVAYGSDPFPDPPAPEPLLTAPQPDTCTLWSEPLLAEQGLEPWPGRRRTPSASDRARTKARRKQARASRRRNRH